MAIAFCDVIATVDTVADAVTVVAPTEAADNALISTLAIPLASVNAVLDTGAYDNKLPPDSENVTTAPATAAPVLSFRTICTFEISIAEIVFVDTPEPLNTSRLMVAVALV